MRRRVRPLRWGAVAVVALAVALALGPQVSAPAAGSQDEPDAQAVLEAVTAYQEVLDAQWTDPTASTGSSRTTTQEEVNQNVRDGIVEDGGTPVTSASSEVELEKAVLQDDGTVLATVIVTTTLLYQGGHEGSMTDPHEMTLEGSDSAGYTVVEDVVPDVPPQPGQAPEGFDPGEPSSQDRQEASPQEAYNQTSPDVEAMVGYALRWTRGNHRGDAKGHFNDAYPYFDSNCANFVSQALHAGGWELEEQGLSASDLAFWAPQVHIVDPRLGDIYHGPTHTWMNASAQHTYVRRGGYERLDNVWNAQPGDLIYADWDPDGQADGELDHVMVVTGTATSEDGGVKPTISQKTNNRNDIMLSSLLSIARSQGRTSINLYGATPEK